MFKSILTVTIVSIACCCLFVWTAQAQEEPQGAAENQFNTSGERIGGLRLGMPEKEFQSLIPCKPQKGKEIYEGGTGEHVQTWRYPECGIALKMSSERKGGAKSIASITITAPSKFATGGGIHIGSTESEVMKAYGQYRDQEWDVKKTNQFVAGSIYDGIIFNLKDGKVVRIFLGAAAE